MPALTFDEFLPKDSDGAARPTSRYPRALTFDDLVAPSPTDTGSFAGYAADVGRSVLSGLDKGVATLAGLPADAARGAIYLSDAEQAYRTGRRYEDVRDERDATAPMSSTVVDALGSAAAHANSPLQYDPQTASGRAAETVTSFVPGALAGGTGLVRNAVARAPEALPALARYLGASVAAPAAGTTVARSANDILGIEGLPAAAIETAGGLIGGGVGAFANRSGQAERALARAAGDLDPQVYRSAQALMDYAAQQGVRLTADEAIQQVTGNATRLSDLRRVVENSRGGGDVLKPMMAERPGQVQRAGEAATDALAPNPLDPTQTGLRVNRAATGEIGDTQAGINAQTRPLYDAASTQRVGPQVHAALTDDALYARTLDEVRGNPGLNYTVAHLPDDSVGVIDMVQRRMREAAENARMPGQASTSNTMAGNLETARRAPIAAAETATGGVTGPYVGAREMQAQLRAQHLEPLTAGPVGRLAATEDAAAQSAALLPNAPKVSGGQAEVADAVRRVATRDPEAAQSLIRGHVRSVFDEATQAVGGNPNQFGGANFASAIAGNGQQAANLEAAVRALPSGDQRWQGFRRFLDVMEATGKRPQAGSATAFNQEVIKDLKQGGIVGDTVAAAKTGGLSLVKRFSDFREQMNLGANTTQVANLLTRPDAARVLGELARTHPNSSRAQVLALRLSYMGRAGAQGRGSSE